jgi:hypothetical protein
MIVHDARLVGKTPLTYRYVMQVNAKTLVDHVVRTVAKNGRQRKLSALHILCHGFEANWDLGAGTCVPAAHGGFGLQLGKEGLTLYNVSKTAAWDGLIDKIVLFACAPADTGAGNEGTWGDGKRFCGELALWTGAEVVAARDTQYYDTHRVAYSGGRAVNETIDFGDWEGPVFSYTRDRPAGVQIAAGAYNMARPG